MMWIIRRPAHGVAKSTVSLKFFTFMSLSITFSLDQTPPPSGSSLWLLAFRAIPVLCIPQHGVLVWQVLTGQYCCLPSLHALWHRMKVQSVLLNEQMAFCDKHVACACLSVGNRGRQPQAAKADKVSGRLKAYLEERRGQNHKTMSLPSHS